MGKKNKPKGRAGAKKKAKKGNSQSDWTSNFTSSSRLSRQMQDYDDDDNALPLFRGFAQNNTPRNFTPRTSAPRLRHQAISFVSGGSNTPVEFQPRPVKDEIFVAAKDSEVDGESEENDDEELDDAAIETNIVMETDMDISKNGIADMSIQSSVEIDGQETDDSSSDAEFIGVDKDVQHASGTFQDSPLFVVDTVGDPTLSLSSKANGKQLAKRDPSPAPSDSSEEVVFQGRNKSAPSSKAATPVKVEQPTMQTVATSKTIPIPNNPFAPRPQTQKTPSTNGWFSPSQTTSSNPTAIGWAARTSKLDQEVNHDAVWAPAPAVPYWKKGKGKGKPRPDLDPTPAERMTLDDAPSKSSKVAFAEPEGEDLDAGKTIATLQADWKAVLREKRQAKQGSRDDDFTAFKSPTSNRRGKRGRRKDNKQLRRPIDSDDDDSLGEAAYDDYMANLAAQMDGNDSNGDIAQSFTATALSTSVGGPSLVVDGKEIADDEVLPSHFEAMGGDDSSSASEGPIGQDLSDLSDEDSELNYSDLESSELEDELEYTEREQWEDEIDLRQRRQDAMTDEQIARLFQKQQEFGYHGDDLVIENGEYFEMDEDIEGVGDVAGARAGLANISNYTFSRPTNKHGMRRSRRANGGFQTADASALADTVDQYGANGFDIMDFDRPSLRPTKKGRKGNLPPELEALSDEDLKETMRTTWDNDRRKKSLKKAEREELRMQGLLGTPGRSGKADLSEKYPWGMSMKQIHEELRTFLENPNQQSRPFPPMAKNDRKALHEIANVLKLNSLSRGSGKDRFPVLTKTSRTVYSPAVLDEAIAACTQGVLGHGGKTARKLAKKNVKAAARGGFGGTAAASLRNGEIVGAGAAELGKENFGHKLMEKMGWSKGMALGREGEGRLLPVEQVVRLGTAGLG